MSESIIKEYSDRYDRYLRDESSEEGSAEWIAFPETTDEVSEVLGELADRGIPYVIQGALTGIKGKAVPHGGCIVNLSRMNHISEVSCSEDGEWYIDAEAGATLEAIRNKISKHSGGPQLFWPPAPSEETATIGGIAASAAFGMNIAGWGDTDHYILPLKTVWNDCITELRLRLLEKKGEVWGTAFFFEDEDMAAKFADFAAENSESADGAKLTALEFIGSAAMELVESSRETLPAISAVPPAPEGTKGIIYIEIEGEEDAIEELLLGLAEASAEYGADPDEAWSFMGETETERFYAYRHAVTEAATQKMAAVHAEDRRLHLISRDIRDESISFSELMKMSRDEYESAGATAAICGCAASRDVRILALTEDFDTYSSIR